MLHVNIRYYIGEKAQFFDFGMEENRNSFVLLPHFPEMLMYSPFSLELGPHCRGWCRAWCQGGQFCISQIHNLGFEPSSCLEVASLVVQMVKNLPATQETRVQPLGGEDPLEKKMATHASILDWRTPLDRGDWWATVHGVTKSQTQLTNTSTFFPRLWEAELLAPFSLFACVCLCTCAYMCV